MVDLDGALASQDLLVDLPPDLVDALALGSSGFERRGGRDRRPVQPREDEGGGPGSTVIVPASGGGHDDGKSLGARSSRIRWPGSNTYAVASSSIVARIGSPAEAPPVARASPGG